MTVIGVDVSKYNLGWQPGKTVKPIDFVIQRVSWAGYKDEKFDAILPEVQNIPVRGAYHYYSSGVPWKTQADLFLSITKNKGFHFYAVDYERAYNNLNSRTVAEFAEFVKYVKAQTGKKCLAYFSPSIYNEFIRPFGYANWANQQDIWIAQYPWTLTQNPGRTIPSLPVGLNNWRIWQYGGGDVNYTAGRHAGADYGGGLVGIDLNYFNGTFEQLQEFAGTVDVPPVVVVPPPVTPPTTGRSATVLVSAINVRTGIWGEILPPSLKAGDKVTVFTTAPDVLNNTWGNIGPGRWICVKWQNKPYVQYDDEISAGMYGFSDLCFYPRDGGGPLTLPMTRSRGKLGDNGLNLKWSEWKPLIEKLNPDNPAAADLIARPDWGPSKGLSGDLIKWIGLLWPGDNVVKIEEIIGGWGRVQGMTSPVSPVIKMEVFDYNKSNGWGHRAKPVFVPIVGGPWWVDMRYLKKI
jgi:hypothetical protein